MDAVIVGGGIGGLAVAAGLHRRGWGVTVLEQTAGFDVAGSAISLWPNAFRALNAVGVTGELGERIGVAGGLRDYRGRWIVRMDSGEAVTHTAGAVIAHRHDLRSALLGHVPAASRMAGVRVRSVRLVGERAVVSHDGGELTADLVIGADGVHSVVRAFVSPAEPRYAGHTAWRMVLPRPTSVDGTASWAETWGPNAVFGMFPMSDNRVYCYGTGAVEPGQHSSDGELAELRRRFAGWCEPIPAVLAAATEELVLRHDIHTLPPLGTYVRGPVALLGDAAHAMVPYLGQGGCQALEDAATLCVAVETQPDLATALRRYDELRRPRTRAMARKSSQSGFVGHLSWAPARVARNALLRAMPTSMFVRSLARPFSWRPEDGLVEVTPIRPAM
ncbi:FAD-dependent monooxygenase [Actinophytocola sp.]|uniref:FAD-dependent monooxygenase n=1 Tax=Actinophytocola sp. TaxID=1872138 RepID=UPI002D40FBAE|nr:FAD-dependent monooxygenase [Actinophytocola sp.]HYQ63706.1 FAD-dependent monooxygenase [Actinophytocola sp.]